MIDNENYYEEDMSSEKSVGLLGKTYLLMFIALAVTAVVSYFFPFILIKTGTEEAYFPFFVGGMIVVIVSSIALNLTQFFKKNGTVSLTLLMIYALAMGFVLSPVALYYSMNVMVCAFSVTSLIFGGLAAYGTFSKKDHFGLGVFATGLMIGCILLSLINLILNSFNLYLVIELLVFAAILAYVIFDANRLARLARQGVNDTATASFMAFQLYTDFIYIFLRLVAIIARNRK